MSKIYKMCIKNNAEYKRVKRCIHLYTYMTYNIKLLYIFNFKKMKCLSSITLKS